MGKKFKELAIWDDIGIPVKKKNNKKICQISASHSNILKFIDAIKREDSLNNLKMKQYVARAPPSTQKNRDFVKRVLGIVEPFDEIAIVENLRGIVHNLRFYILYLCLPISKIKLLKPL